jgi:beta-galactosidase
MKTMLISSNCDHLKLFVKKTGGWELFAEADPDRAQFPHLKYAPFTINMMDTFGWGWGDLKIEGYIKGALKTTKLYSGRGVDRKFEAVADDSELFADGGDATRVVLRVTDEFGNVRPFANDPIVFKLEGPADLIGDNPFALFGGVGAVWLRAKEQAGTVRLTAIHPRLGAQTITVTVQPATAETA